MENRWPADADQAASRGPRKGSGSPATPPLSRPRAAVLETVRAQPSPSTLAALVDETGLHANTLREHLEALEAEGLVRRARATPSGRGRPAWLYEATEPPERSEYAGLAATLAAAIHRSSPDPRADAIAAGREWGHELAREKGRPGPGQPAARRQVVAMLTDLGFAPEADERASAALLTRCPLLEAAHRFPDVVCGVHLGIVRGALDEYGGDAERTDLHPFAEPNGCRLELLTARTAEHR